MRGIRAVCHALDPSVGPVLSYLLLCFVIFRKQVFRLAVFNLNDHTQSDPETDFLELILCPPSRKFAGLLLLGQPS